MAELPSKANSYVSNLGETMQHLRSAVAFAVALVLGVGACQDSGTVLEPASVQQNRTPLASCDVVVPDDHTTISAGVAAASSGSTVCVLADGGPYQEQVVIDKDLVLSGIGGPTVEAPADPGDFTIPESGETWEPVVFAFGGTASGGDVSGSGTIEVTVQGFTVDGADRQPNTSRSVGIFYRNVEGDVTANTVENMGVGGKETFGILAYGDSDVKIRDNVVTDYERGGIGANGDGGAHPAPEAHISGNDVSSEYSGIGEAWAPNGIQIGFGATGNIMDNVVTDNRWSGDGWVASCIIVFETDGVNVKKNEVENCDAGITVGSWAWINPPSADNTEIQGNSVTKASVGIYLQAVAWNGLSTADPSVSNSKIVRNEIDGGDLGEDGGVGIALLASDADPDFDPIVENNKIIRNSITGFDTNIEEFGTDDTKQRANVFK